MRCQRSVFSPVFIWVLRNMAASSIEVHDLSEQESARLRSSFDSIVNYNQAYVRTEPGKCLLPCAYAKYKDRIKCLEIRPDDIVLLTYPKCGTHWMIELITLLKNDFDFEKTQAVPLLQKAMGIDLSFLLDVLREEQSPVDQIMEDMEKLESPRLIVSHLPFCLLPGDLIDNCKVIVCLRNPKDTVVSKYHFEKTRKPIGFVGDFATYFDLYMEGLVPYGSFFEHVKQAWEKRHHQNVCVVFFEGMKKDMASNLRRVATFMGKDFSDKQIGESVEFLSFKKTKERGGHDAYQVMTKKDDGDGDVLRKGIAGDWKNFFKEEMNARMDEAIEKHLKPIGLEFEYE